MLARNSNYTAILILAWYEKQLTRFFLWKSFGYFFSLLSVSFVSFLVPSEFSTSFSHISLFLGMLFKPCAKNRSDSTFILLLSKPLLDGRSQKKAVAIGQDKLWPAPDFPPDFFN